MKCLKRSAFFFLTILFLLTAAYSQNYADIDIFVEENGAVTIEGTTNYEPLKVVDNSQKFTSKQGEYWILNITTNETFDNFIYELNLPEGSEVNYIKTTPNLRIDQESNRIKLIGTGEDKLLTIIVQYKINPTSTNFLTQQKIITLLVIVILFIFSISGYLLYRVLQRTKDTDLKEPQANKENIPHFNIDNLPIRQKDIVKLVERNKKMTQKQIEEAMDIPKSSVSRNVQALVIKRILIKEKAGQSNYIMLSEEIPKN